MCNSNKDNISSLLIFGYTEGEKNGALLFFFFFLCLLPEELDEWKIASSWIWHWCATICSRSCRITGKIDDKYDMLFLCQTSVIVFKTNTCHNYVTKYQYYQINSSFIRCCVLWNHVFTFYVIFLAFLIKLISFPVPLGQHSSLFPSIFFSLVLSCDCQTLSSYNLSKEHSSCCLWFFFNGFI